MLFSLGGAIKNRVRLLEEITTASTTHAYVGGQSGASNAFGSSRIAMLLPTITCLHIPIENRHLICAVPCKPM